MNTASIQSASQRNYGVSGAEPETKKSLDTNDFFKLIAAQLSHQDVLNPTGGTEFIAQMAQFSSLQTAENNYQAAQSQLDALATLLEMTYAQYGAGLVGKEVLVATVNENGAYQEISGPVERVSLGGGSYAVWVNGKAYSMSSVMEIRQSAPQTEAADG